MLACSFLRLTAEFINVSISGKRKDTHRGEGERERRRGDRGVCALQYVIKLLLFDCVAYAFLCPLFLSFILSLIDDYCARRMLGEKLNMDAESAERWIVNLIRNARLDAKIDSKNNTVIMGSQYPSVYQRVIEKTKGLTFRSQLLANNLTKSSAAPTANTSNSDAAARFMVPCGRGRVCVSVTVAHTAATYTCYDCICFFF